MFEDAAGKRCIKMAPPVAPKKSPDHEFDAEMPTRGKKLKSVLYKYNKKVRQSWCEVLQMYFLCERLSVLTSRFLLFVII